MFYIYAIHYFSVVTCDVFVVMIPHVFICLLKYLLSVLHWEYMAADLHDNQLI